MMVKHRRAILVFLAIIFPFYLFAEKNVHVSEDDGHGWLGVVVRTLDTELRDEYDTRARYGALVAKVIPGGPAEEAGLAEGDVIVKVENSQIHDAESLIDELNGYEPDDEIRITAWRERDKMTVDVRLDERPTINIKKRKNPHIFHTFPLGLKVQNLDENLATYFDINAGDGILIAEVAENSAADEAGLQSGDILTHLKGRRISSTQEFYDVIDSYEEGDEIDAKYLRQGRSKRTTIIADDSINDPVQNFYGKGSRYFIPNPWGQFHDFPFNWQEHNGEIDEDWERLQAELDELKKALGALKSEIREMRKDMDESKSQ